MSGGPQNGNVAWNSPEERRTDFNDVSTPASQASTATTPFRAVFTTRVRGEDQYDLVGEFSPNEGGVTGTFRPDAQWVKIGAKKTIYNVPTSNVRAHGHAMQPASAAHHDPLLYPQISHEDSKPMSSSESASAMSTPVSAAAPPLSQATQSYAAAASVGSRPQRASPTSPGSLARVRCHVRFAQPRLAGFEFRVRVAAHPIYRGEKCVAVAHAQVEFITGDVHTFQEMNVTPGVSHFYVCTISTKRGGLGITTKVECVLEHPSRIHVPRDRMSTFDVFFTFPRVTHDFGFPLTSAEVCPPLSMRDVLLEFLSAIVDDGSMEGSTPGRMMERARVLHRQTRVDSAVLLALTHRASVSTDANRVFKYLLLLGMFLQHGASHCAPDAAARVLSNIEQHLDELSDLFARESDYQQDFCRALDFICPTIDVTYSWMVLLVFNKEPPKPQRERLEFGGNWDLFKQRVDAIKVSVLLRPRFSERTGCVKLFVALLNSVPTLAALDWLLSEVSFRTAGSDNETGSVRIGDMARTEPIVDEEIEATLKEYLAVVPPDDWLIPPRLELRCATIAFDIVVTDHRCASTHDWTETVWLKCLKFWGGEQRERVLQQSIAKGGVVPAGISAPAEDLYLRLIRHLGEEGASTNDNLDLGCPPEIAVTYGDWLQSRVGLKQGASCEIEHVHRLMWCTTAAHSLLASHGPHLLEITKHFCSDTHDIGADVMVKWAVRLPRVNRYESSTCILKLFDWAVTKGLGGPDPEKAPPLDTASWMLGLVSVGRNDGALANLAIEKTLTAVFVGGFVLPEATVAERRDVDHVFEIPMNEFEFWARAVQLSLHWTNVREHASYREFARLLQAFAGSIQDGSMTAEQVLQACEWAERFEQIAQTGTSLVAQALQNFAQRDREQARTILSALYDYNSVVQQTEDRIQHGILFLEKYAVGARDDDMHLAALDRLKRFWPRMPIRELRSESRAPAFWEPFSLKMLERCSKLFALRNSTIFGLIWQLHTDAVIGPATAQEPTVSEQPDAPDAEVKEEHDGDGSSDAAPAAATLSGNSDAAVGTPASVDRTLSVQEFCFSVGDRAFRELDEFKAHLQQTPPTITIGRLKRYLGSMNNLSEEIHQLYGGSLTRAASGIARTNEAAHANITEAVQRCLDSIKRVDNVYKHVRCIRNLVEAMKLELDEHNDPLLKAMSGVEQCVNDDDQSIASLMQHTKRVQGTVDSLGNILPLLEELQNGNELFELLQEADDVRPLQDAVEGGGDSFITESTIRDLVRLKTRLDPVLQLSRDSPVRDVLMALKTAAKDTDLSAAAATCVRSATGLQRLYKNISNREASTRERIVALVEGGTLVLQVQGTECIASASTSMALGSAEGGGPAPDVKATEEHFSSAALMDFRQRALLYGHTPIAVDAEGAPDPAALNHGTVMKQFIDIVDIMMSVADTVTSLCKDGSVMFRHLSETIPVAAIDKLHALAEHTAAVQARWDADLAEALRQHYLLSMFCSAQLWVLHDAFFSPTPSPQAISQAEALLYLASPSAMTQGARERMLGSIQLGVTRQTSFDSLLAHGGNQGGFGESKSNAIPTEGEDVSVLQLGEMITDILAPADAEDGKPYIHRPLFTSRSIGRWQYEQGQALASLVALYARAGEPFPLRHQLLFCGRDTSLAEIKAFVHRAFFASDSPLEEPQANERTFTIVSVERLGQQAHHCLLQKIKELARERKRLGCGYKLALLCERGQIAELNPLNSLSSDQLVGGFMSPLRSADATAYVGDHLTSMDKKVLVVSSASPGLGKSSWIHTHALQQGMELLPFPFSGTMDRLDMVRRLLASAFTAQTCLQLDLSPFRDLHVADTLLFELILCGSVLGPVNSVDHAVAHMVKCPLVCIEVANVFRGSLADADQLWTCSLFPAKHIRWRDELLVATPMITSDMQICCNYLRTLAAGQMDRAVLGFGQYVSAEDAPTAVPASVLDSQTCAQILRSRFWQPGEDPTFTSTDIFLRVLGDQLRAYTLSPFMSPTHMESILTRNKHFRSEVLLGLLRTAHMFSDRSVRSAREAQAAAQAQGPTPDELDMIVARTDSDNMVSWSAVRHCLLFLDARGSLTLLFRDASDVPDSIKDVWISQDPNHQLPNLAKLKSDDLIGRLDQIVTTCGRTRAETVKDKVHNYVITLDNLLKQVLIYMRLVAGVPVVLMGETGCGKTSLAEFLAYRAAVRLEVVQLHAGTSVDKIIQAVEKCEQYARATDNPVWIFWDEVNTSDHLHLVNEIVCHKRLLGRKLDRRIASLAACNPYRKRHEAELRSTGFVHKSSVRDSMSRLVYRVHPLPETMMTFLFDFGALTSADEMAYVQAMLKDIEDVWPNRHHELDNTTARWLRTLATALVIESQEFMRNDYVISLRDVRRFKTLLEFFLEDVQARRKYPAALQQQEHEGQHASILQTGIAGAARVAQAARGLFHRKGQRRATEVSNSFEVTLILALGHCYHSRLSSATECDDYWTRIAEKWCTHLNRNQAYRTGEQLLNTLRSEQIDYLNRMELERGTARNSALLQNVFVLLISILNRIPVFLVGKPGCSKSLSMSLISQSLRGRNSRDKYFKTLPQMLAMSYQGSEDSKSEGLERVFEKAERYATRRSAVSSAAFAVATPYAGDNQHSEAREHNLATNEDNESQCEEATATDSDEQDKTVVCVILDEVGLAEVSPHNPLKVLHYSLERDAFEDFSNEEGACLSYAVVGISNWNLDASKMNRAIHLNCPDPDLDDLNETANEIFAGGASADVPVTRSMTDAVRELLMNVAQAYSEVRSETDKNHRTQNFYGLRDFYAAVKQLSHAAKGTMPPRESIIRCAARNFGGLHGRFIGHHNDPRFIEQSVCRRLCPGHDMNDLPSVIDLVMDNLKDKDARHLMLITKSDAALCIVEQQRPTTSSTRHAAAAADGRDTPTVARANSSVFGKGVEVMIGSRFEEDQGDAYNYRALSKVILCMESGRKLILYDHGAIYGALYDMLNQHYQIVAGKRNCRVALGADSNPLCAVHEDFRAVVLMDADRIEFSDPPFLNRFEKQILQYVDVLEPRQREVVLRLDNWTRDISLVAGTKWTREHVFHGYSQRTMSEHVLPSLVLHEHEILDKAIDGAQVSEDALFQACQTRLLHILSADSVVRMAQSDWVQQSGADRARWLSRTYFEVCGHANLHRCWEAKREQGVNRLVVLTYSHSMTDVLTSFPTRDAQQVHEIHLAQIKTERQLEQEIASFWSRPDVQAMDSDQSCSAAHASLLVVRADVRDHAQHLMLTRHLLQHYEEEYIADWDEQEGEVEELSSGSASRQKSQILLLHLSRDSTPRPCQSTQTSTSVGGSDKHVRAEAEQQWAFSFLSGWDQFMVEELDGSLERFELLKAIHCDDLSPLDKMDVDGMIQEAVPEALRTISYPRFLLDTREHSARLAAQLYDTGPGRLLLKELRRRVLTAVASSTDATSLSAVAKKHVALAESGSLCEALFQAMRNEIVRYLGYLLHKLESVSALGPLFCLECGDCNAELRLWKTACLHDSVLGDLLRDQIPVRADVGCYDLSGHGAHHRYSSWVLSHTVLRIVQREMDRRATFVRDRILSAAIRRPSDRWNSWVSVLKEPVVLDPMVRRVLDALQAAESQDLSRADAPLAEDQCGLSDGATSAAADQLDGAAEHKGFDPEDIVDGIRLEVHMHEAPLTEAHAPNAAAAIDAAADARSRPAPQSSGHNDDVDGDDAAELDDPAATTATGDMEVVEKRPRFKPDALSITVLTAPSAVLFGSSFVAGWTVWLMGLVAILAVVSTAAIYVYVLPVLPRRPRLREIAQDLLAATDFELAVAQDDANDDAGREEEAAREAEEEARKQEAEIGDEIDAQVQESRMKTDRAAGTRNVQRDLETLEAMWRSNHERYFHDVREAVVDRILQSCAWPSRRLPTGIDSEQSARDAVRGFLDLIGLTWDKFSERHPIDIHLYLGDGLEALFSLYGDQMMSLLNSRVFIGPVEDFGGGAAAQPGVRSRLRLIAQTSCMTHLDNLLTLCDQGIARSRRPQQVAQAFQAWFCEAQTAVVKTRALSDLARTEEESQAILMLHARRTLILAADFVECVVVPHSIGVQTVRRLFDDAVTNVRAPSPENMIQELRDLKDGCSDKDQVHAIEKYMCRVFRFCTGFCGEDADEFMVTAAMDVGAWMAPPPVSLFQVVTSALEDTFEDEELPPLQAFEQLLPTQTEPLPLLYDDEVNTALGNPHGPHHDTWMSILCVNVLCDCAWRASVARGEQCGPVDLRREASLCSTLFRAAVNTLLAAMNDSNSTNPALCLSATAYVRLFISAMAREVSDPHWSAADLTPTMVELNDVLADSMQTSLHSVLRLYFLRELRKAHKVGFVDLKQRCSAKGDLGRHFPFVRQMQPFGWAQTPGRGRLGFVPFSSGSRRANFTSIGSLLGRVASGTTVEEVEVPWQQALRTPRDRSYVMGILATRFLSGGAGTGIRPEPAETGRAHSHGHGREQKQKNPQPQTSGQKQEPQHEKHNAHDDTGFADAVCAAVDRAALPTHIHTQYLRKLARAPQDCFGLRDVQGKCSQLMRAFQLTGDTPMEDTVLVGLFLHFLNIVLSCMDDSFPFKAILCNAPNILDRYLPAAASDDTAMVFAALGSTEGSGNKFVRYRCNGPDGNSCGYVYTVFDCGETNQVGICPNCGNNIGNMQGAGAHTTAPHQEKLDAQPTLGQAVADGIVRDHPGWHPHGVLARRGEHTVRGLPPLAFRILHMFAHMAFLGHWLLFECPNGDVLAVVSGQDDDTEAESPEDDGSGETKTNGATETAGSPLADRCWERLRADLTCLSTSLLETASLEEIAALLHETIHSLPDVPVIADAADHMSSATLRLRFERNFAESCVQQHSLQSGVDATAFARQCLEGFSEQQDTVDTLECLVNEQPLPPIEAQFNQGPVFTRPSARHWHSTALASFEGLRRAFFSDGQNTQRYPFLNICLQQNYLREVCMVSHLWNLVQWPLHMVRQWSGRLTRADVNGVEKDVSFVLRAATPGQQSQADTLRPLYDHFIASWNAVRCDITQYECAEISLPELPGHTDGAHLVFGCPSDTNEGALLLAAWTHLARIQNNFLQHSLTLPVLNTVKHLLPLRPAMPSAQEGQPVPVGATGATATTQETADSDEEAPLDLVPRKRVQDMRRAHLITCDFEDIVNKLLLHSMPGLDYGEGRHIRYDFAKQEQDLMEELLLGKVMIDNRQAEIPLFKFAGESFVAAPCLLQHVRDTIPQQLLPNAAAIRGSNPAVANASKAMQLITVMERVFFYVAEAGGSNLGYLHSVSAFKPELPVFDFAATWLPTHCQNLDPQQRQLLKDVTLCEMEALFELLEDIVSDAVVREACDDRFRSAALSSDEKEEVMMLCARLVPPSRGGQDRGVEVLEGCVRRFMRRYLCDSVDKSPSSAMQTYSTLMWSNECSVSEDEFMEAFPPGIRLAQAFQLWSWLQDCAKGAADSGTAAAAAGSTAPTAAAPAGASVPGAAATAKPLKKKGKKKAIR